MNMLKEYAPWYVLGALLLANIFIWPAVFEGERDGILTVAFLDVGQGDAIYIEAPNGSQMLVDGGANGSVLRELSKLMPFYDRSIDILVATHPDQDHIGGFLHILDRYEVRTILRSGAHNDTEVYEGLNARIEERSVEEIIAERGMEIALDEGVTATILFPDRDVSTIDPNNASIVMKLVYGESEFLLTGDAPKSIEQFLVKLDGKNIQSDVLKVSHHGSKTSSDQLFLGFASPTYAIISAGVDNRYGHPHSEVVERIEQFGADILATYEEGTIVFETDGSTIHLK